jgi:hypothetical protein
MPASIIFSVGQITNVTKPKMVVIIASFGTALKPRYLMRID